MYSVLQTLCRSRHKLVHYLEVDNGHYNIFLNIVLTVLNRCHGIGMVDSFKAMFTRIQTFLKPHMFYLDSCGRGINLGLNFNLGSSPLLFKSIFLDKFFLTF